MALETKNSLGIPSRRVILIAQQIHFAKLLSGNNETLRNKGIKKLQRYFSIRNTIEFTEDDLMRIWKGLFYCMWMSDKPLVQENQAEMMSNLIHCFTNTNTGMLFIHTFFRTMMDEWFGIDNHRLDKFLMLVRRFLRQTLTYCRKQDWDKGLVFNFSELLNNTVLKSSLAGGGFSKLPPPGFTMHLIDIFLEELAKIGNESLPQDVVLELVRPFIQCLAGHTDWRVRQHIIQHIFHHLMKQTDIGIEYEEKFQAWRSASYPGESCLQMELVEEEAGPDDEEDPKELIDPNIKDPRAGHVDVILPQLHFNPKKIAKLLFEYSKKSPHLKNRRTLKQLADQFTQLAKGQYPLAFKFKFTDVFRKPPKGEYYSSLWTAARKLEEYEESQLEEDEKAGTLRNKKGKRKHDATENQDLPEKKFKKQNVAVIQENNDIHNHLNNNKNNMVPKGIKHRGEIKLKGEKRTVSDIKENEIKNNLKTCEVYSKMNLTKGVKITSTKHKAVNRNLDNFLELKSVQKSVVASPKPLKCNREEPDTIQRESLDSVAVMDTPVRKRNSFTSHPKTDCAIIQRSVKKRRSYLTQWEVTDIPNARMQEQDTKISEVMTKTSSGFVVERKCLPQPVSIAVTSASKTETDLIKLKHTTPLLTNVATPTKVKVPTIISNNTDKVIAAAPAKLVHASLGTDKATTPATMRNATPVSSKATSLKLSNSAPTPILLRKPSTPGSGKKVNIALQMNKIQAISEYEMAVKKSPAIPFDANKKPTQGVLKPCPISSPINPFYRLSKIKL